MAEKYLIDANIFFQAKELWYKFSYALPFWKWLEAGYGSDQFFSIKKVRSEILAGKPTCPVRAWINSSISGKFFLDDDKTTSVNTHYQSLMTWAAAEHAAKVYTFAALSEFANNTKADAWLVAAAKHYGCTIVTHETATTGTAGVGKIKIPNAAGVLGVKTVTLFQLLDKHAGAAFTYKP